VYFHFFQIVCRILLKQIYFGGVGEKFRIEGFRNFHLSLTFCSPIDRRRQVVGFIEFLYNKAVILEQ
jgi:hypothetical protein